MIKNIIFFVSGAALGFGICYIVVKKKIEERAQNDINEAKEEYKKRAENVSEESEDEEEDEPEERKDLVFNVPEKPDIMKVMNDKMISYNGYSDSATKSEKASRDRKNRKYDNKANWEAEADEEDIDDEEYDEVEYTHPSEGTAEEPYDITPAQFASENTHFDKMTLIYYEDDGILATEEDEQVTSEAKSMLGDNYVEILKESDEDAVYFRNEKMASDFEVILDKSSYYDRFISEG